MLPAVGLCPVDFALQLLTSKEETTPPPITLIKAVQRPRRPAQRQPRRHVPARGRRGLDRERPITAAAALLKGQAVHLSGEVRRKEVRSQHVGREE